MFTYRITYKITVEEKSYIITYIKIPKTGLTTDDKTNGNSTLKKKKKERKKEKKERKRRLLCPVFNFF